MKKQQLNKKEKIIAKLKTKLEKLLAKENYMDTHVGWTFYSRAFAWIIACGFIGAGVCALGSFLAGVTIINNAIISGLLSTVVGLLTCGLVANFSLTLHRGRISNALENCREKLVSLEAADTNEFKQEVSLKMDKLPAQEQHKQIENIQAEMSPSGLVKRLVKENLTTITAVEEVDDTIIANNEHTIDM